MKQIQLAVIGLGRLGRACADAILKDEQFTLTGIVRRAESLGQRLPERYAHIPVAGHIRDLGHADAALVCVPTEHTLGVVHDLIQGGTPVVECAGLHGEAFLAHKHEIDRLAKHHKVPAIVGAGWDPGALSLFRALFSMLTPRGHTETTRRPGVSLHHSTVADAIPGVHKALSTELRTSEGFPQRYVYVELDAGAELSTVSNAIRSDPLFAGEETQVFAVESIATMEEEGHGVLMERRGSAAGVEHQLLLLEGRFSELALSAQVMLAATVALPTRKRRAYGLFDLPLGALWGALREQAESEWI